MDFISIILLGIGLAMDCFAVSVAQGMQGTRMRSVIVMAILFGVFQGGMPIITFFAGSIFAAFFSRWSYWIALILLLLIGGKMLLEARRESKDGEKELSELCTRNEKVGIGTMFMLAVATSIDALSIGVLFIPVPDVLWVAITIIALTSTLFALIGYWIGKTLGEHLPFNANCIGGWILIAIGVKIFIEGLLG